MAKDGRARVSKICVYELLGDDFVTKESLNLKLLASRSINRESFPPYGLLDGYEKGLRWMRHNTCVKKNMSANLSVTER